MAPGRPSSASKPSAFSDTTPLWFLTTPSMTTRWPRRLFGGGVSNVGGVTMALAAGLVFERDEHEPLRGSRRGARSRPRHARGRPLGTRRISQRTRHPAAREIRRAYVIGWGPSVHAGAAEIRVISSDSDISGSGDESRPAPFRTADRNGRALPPATSPRAAYRERPQLRRCRQRVHSAACARPTAAQSRPARRTAPPRAASTLRPTVSRKPAAYFNPRRNGATAVF